VIKKGGEKGEYIIALVCRGGMGGIGGITPQFLDFSTRWWRMVNFMTLPLYTHRKSGLWFKTPT
jgi:hypothetical protein